LKKKRPAAAPRAQRAGGAGRRAGRRAGVAADDRGGGDDATRLQAGREDFHRDDEREERQADRAAEAEVAAQREGEEQHRDAVGELEGGEVVDQGVSKILRYLRTPLPATKFGVRAH